jgi:hypothetical protein
MSFDLKLASQLGQFDLLEHDILLSNNLQTVTGNGKLEQDIQKIILTSKNYFHPKYGTSIETLIGTNYGIEQTKNIIAQQIVDALVYYQNLQSQQAKYQNVLASEKLETISSVNVVYQGNTTGATQQQLFTFTVALKVADASGKTLDVYQNISLG